jgi:hypothetical protein
MTCYLTFSEVLNAELYSMMPVKTDSKPAMATLAARYSELRGQLEQLRIATEVRLLASSSTPY